MTMRAEPDWFGVRSSCHGGRAHLTLCSWFTVRLPHAQRGEEGWLIAKSPTTSRPGSRAAALPLQQSVYRSDLIRPATSHLMNRG